MSGLERFLKKNKQARENVFYPACSGIREEDGSVVDWELKYLTTAECEAIKRSCIREVENRSGIVSEGLTPPFIWTGSLRQAWFTLTFGVPPCRTATGYTPPKSF